MGKRQLEREVRVGETCDETKDRDIKTEKKRYSIFMLVKLEVDTSTHSHQTNKITTHRKETYLYVVK